MSRPIITCFSGQSRPARSVEDLLKLLEETTVPRQTLDAHCGLSTTGTHTDMLCEVLMKREEAEDMLSAAGLVRREASARASDILNDAQRWADGLRDEVERHVERAQQESADWAAEQHAVAATLVEELIENARRDAEVIRVDAETLAMAEAKKTAERYRQHTATCAMAAADEIRAEVYEALDQSSRAVEEITASLRALSLALVEFCEDLCEHDRVVRELLAGAGLDRGGTSVVQGLLPMAGALVSIRPEHADADVMNFRGERSNAAAKIRRPAFHPGAGAFSSQAEVSRHGVPEAG